MKSHLNLREFFILIRKNNKRAEAPLNSRGVGSFASVPHKQIFFHNGEGRGPDFQKVLMKEF